MITISGWLVIALAARRMCSSSCRFIFTQNVHSFLAAENATKRTGLAQAPGLLPVTAEQVENVLMRAMPQDFPPFQENGWWIRLPLIDPPLQCLHGALQQVGLRLQFISNQPVQSQAALVNPFVRSHGPLS